MRVLIQLRKCLRHSARGIICQIDVMTANFSNLTFYPNSLVKHLNSYKSNFFTFILSEHVLGSLVISLSYNMKKKVVSHISNAV